jgi:hypothetical protein
MVGKPLCVTFDVATTVTLPRITPPPLIEEGTQFEPSKARY